MIRLPAFAFAAAFVALSAFADDVPKTPRVFVIGDSISMQYGPFLEQYLAGTMGYARKVAEDPVVQALDPPQGGNGGDSNAVRAYIEAKEKAGGFESEILLLNCGLHDIKKTRETGAMQVPLDQYEANLKAIVDCAQRMKMTVVWVRTTPVDDAQHNDRSAEFTRHAADCAAYNAAADKVMAEKKVASIDLHGFCERLGLPANELFSDHVHFPVPVREKQAAYIAGWLTARFAGE